MKHQFFKAVASIMLIFLILLSPEKSNALEELPKDELNQTEWNYVVIMLNSPKQSLDINEQKKNTAELQNQALNGPLSTDFRLVYRYETVPALAGWIKRVGSEVPLQRALNNDNNIILKIDEDISGGAEPLFQNEGGGGLYDSVPLIEADKLHKKGITGKNIEVAVLDSGIDSDHPDLADSILAEQCFCFNPQGGCCPDGSNVQSGTGSAEDDHGHGTHVSGIITSNGTVGPVGVAPDAGITMIKMMDSFNSFYSTSDIVAALDWLNVNRPELDIVSMSLYTNISFSDACDQTYSWTQALYAAVQNLVAKGVIVVAIAGNDGQAGSITAPGCLSNVINVGASDKSDVVAQFSNSHSEVDLFAPGVNIQSDEIGGGTVLMSGTSMACPHVSALGALLKQVSPIISENDFLQIATDTGMLLTDWNGLERPRINAFAAACSLSLFNCSTTSVINIVPILELLFE